MNLDDEYDFRDEENLLRCVICNTILKENDTSGLCDDHKYDEQLEREVKK